jgi:peptidoglycan/LPS O-acetylase OafA/YrhL
MLHFKTRVHFPQTMIWFGVLAYFWVKNEIAYGKHHLPNRHLVAAGAWSYSLYLIHAQGMGAFWRLPLPFLGYFVSWFAALFSSFGLSYIFYILVERPSHRLARRVSVSSQIAPP